MEFSLTKPQEHFEQMLRKPSPSSEEKLYETTYPTLLGPRGINNRKNKFDVINENKELVKGFLFLCEHNLLFFLTAIGRFDIIRSLLKPHHRPSKGRNLLRKKHAKPAIAAPTPKASSCNATLLHLLQQENELKQAYQKDSLPSSFQLALRLS